MGLSMEKKLSIDPVGTPLDANGRLIDFDNSTLHKQTLGTPPKYVAPR
jgi:hypothetical protein